MQIFMNGQATNNFAPDSIYASVTFSSNAKSYDEALKIGVENVKSYIQQIINDTDFSFDDFKTKAYSVREKYYTNRIDPKTEADLGKNLQQRITEGFFFTQYAYIEFDYNKERLAKLLVLSSRIPNAPALNINFKLKDIESKNLELIAGAYEDAKKKAEALATAAHKDLRDCLRVEIDPVSRNTGYEGPFKMSERSSSDSDIEQQIKNIDETFKPDDIIVSKRISCVWETSN